jgi:carboxymethylenebutenolidase
MSTDFKGYLLEEFLEDYQDGLLTRREAVKLIAGVVGSLATANVLVAACAPRPAPVVASPGAATATDSPQATQPADPTQPTQPTRTPASTGEVLAEDISFRGRDATLLAHLARPAGAGPHPAVLVCHENRGLTEHIKDVARRLAAAGYVGLAVDLLSRQGGTPAAGDPSQIPGLLANMPPAQFVQDYIDAWTWLREQTYVRADGVGMVGFCFGGGVTWRVAIGLPDLRAAVPFYGPHPDPDDVASIQAAVLAIYAGRDTRINQSIPAIEAAMQAADTVYEKVIYPDTDHAFHNDTGSRYDPDAARDAWSRTLGWFEEYLRTR